MTQMVESRETSGCYGKWPVMIYDDLYIRFMMIYDDLWWIMMIYDDLWWFMMIYDDLWWFMMIYRLKYPKGKFERIRVDTDKKRFTFSNTWITWAGAGWAPGNLPSNSTQAVRTLKILVKCLGTFLRTSLKNGTIFLIVKHLKDLDFDNKALW